MKHCRIFCFAFLAAVLASPVLEAQSLKGMSLNGATGLYSIPSGRIGWEQSSNLGLDLGYHTVIRDNEATHIPKLSMSLFKWVELSGAFDIQPDGYAGYWNNDGVDFVGGAKVQFPLKNTALAIGGNYQALNMGEDPGFYSAGQIYAAVTYAGQFFTMPAETTVVVGKTFIEEEYSPHEKWDIDFGMGFDLILLPKVFENLVHWIVDFANFSYSVEAFGAEPLYRGVLNTGLRFDLATIPALSKFKFAIDVLMTDAFDEDRAFSAGLVFGIPIL